MQRSAIHHVVIVAVLLSFIAVLVPVPVVAQAPGVNLLTNGDFEAWDPATGHWPMMWGIPEVQICPGWQAFWVQDAPAGAPMSENWKRPEFRDTKVAEADYRVRSGERAQKYFSFGGQHIAGLYQQVSGITPGTTLRFEVYMQTWGCMPGDEGWNKCPTGHNSNSPSPFHTRVGIDPTGGTSFGAASLVWSGEQEAYDQWTHFYVDAVAQSSTVTVFTYSHVDWNDNVFRVNNDVYVDDATLVALDAPLVDLTAPEPEAEAETAPQAEAPPADDATADAVSEPAPPAATPIPQPTATPRPDGAIVHTVQSGDTLLAIALDYEVDAEQIRALNNLDESAWLSIGQELVIAVGDAAAAVVGAVAVPEAEVAAASDETPVVDAPAASESEAASQPVAANLVLPTPTAFVLGAVEGQRSAPTPAPSATQAESDKRGNGFTLVSLTLAVVLGIGLGVVMSGRVKLR